MEPRRWGTRTRKVPPDIDFSKPRDLIQDLDTGLLALRYYSSEGEEVLVPVTVAGLGHPLGSKVTLASWRSSPVEPKDVNRLISSRGGSGTIIFQDSFEDDTFHWFTTPADQQVDGVTERSLNRAHSGRASLYIRNPVVSSDQDARRTFTHKSDLVGMEFWFSFNDNMRLTAAGQTVYGSLEFWDGVNRLEARADFRTNSKVWVIKTGAQVDKTVANANYRSYDDATATRSRENWNWVKIVADRQTKEWVSLETAEDYFDLKGTPLNQIADNTVVANTKHWGIELAMFVGSVQADMEAYYDDVVVTDERPWG